MVSKRMTILILLLAIPLFLFAQDQQTTGQAAQGAGGVEAAKQPTIAEVSTNFGAGLYRASAGINVPIATEAGDFSGTVHDLIATNNGSIRFLVVDVTQGAAAGEMEQQGGGAPGAAANDYLVPADRVRWMADSNSFQVDLPEGGVSALVRLESGSLPADMPEEAAAATGPQPNTVPSQPAPTGTAATEPEAAARGPQPSLGPSPAAPTGVAAGAELASRYLFINRLIGTAVYNQKNDELGRVEDVVLNVPQWRIQYLAVSTADVLGLGEKYFAVPMRVFIGWQPDVNQVVVSIPRERFASGIGYQPSGAWPGDADQAFDISASGDTQSRSE